MPETSTLRDLIVTLQSLGTRADPLTSLKMKILKGEERIKVPKDCKVTIKSRKVEVSGKNGVLKRDFSHLPVDIALVNGGKEIEVAMWFGHTKQLAAMRTVCSHIDNCFSGVQSKFQYTMRLVYAHFPINANITNGGKTVEIRNFLGEKIVRTVNMLPGVICEKGTGEKDQLVLTGADIDCTSGSAALIRQSCLVKNKDIRKFLDGIYVSSHGVIEA